MLQLLWRWREELDAQGWQLTSRREMEGFLLQRCGGLLYRNAVQSILDNLLTFAQLFSWPVTVFGLF